MMLLLLPTYVLDNAPGDDLPRWAGPAVVLGFAVLLALVVLFLVLLVRTVVRALRPIDRGWLPPDWYPQGDGTERYWNGTAWTTSRPHRRVIHGP